MTATTPQTLPLEVALRQAVAHHQAGRLQEAERLYRGILQAQPDHPDANHNLGVLAVQAKQPAAGLPHFKIALESVPNRGQYWLSYIDALIRAGQIDAARQVLAQGRQRGLQGEAVEALAERLKVGVQVTEQPDAKHQQADKESLLASTEAMHLNNPKLTKRGRLVRGTGLKQKRNHGPIEINTLVTMFKEGRYTEAATFAQEITVRFPRHGAGWKALGVAFMKTGRSEDALVPMQKAAALLSRDAEAHTNLGFAFYELGRLDEAEASYRRALEINPDYAEAYNNLGNTLNDLGRLDEAEIALRRALQINKGYAKAYSNLGNILNKLDRLDEAVATYRRALQINPDFAEAHYNLANALGNLGRLNEAVASLLRALEIKPDYTEANSYLLFIYNLLPNHNSAEMLLEANHYGRLAAKHAHPFNSWDNIPDTSKRLRIGLVSGDLYSHPVGFFLESVLKSLATQFSSQIEIFAYPCYPKNDVVTARIRSCCHGWHSAVGLSDENLARRIRADGIDILIDLSGHTAHNRLPMFAWKPAPVQVSWLGYFATTGVTAIDYLIADPWVLPEVEEVNFTERIWRLPETRLCFTPPDVEVEVTSLPALANGYITFGCFNNLVKMNDDVVALWSRVLASVLDSRLFLKTKQLNDPIVRKNTVERFVAHGVDASRLILEGSESRERYLAAYHRVDIALDPFPFPGGTTSVEGLWMGVPVLTLESARFLSRQGVGILMNAGLPEWVAANADDYVARAMLHAGDLHSLAMLRNSLRQQVLASPIFNASHFARNFEIAMRGMWHVWCDNQIQV